MKRIQDFKTFSSLQEANIFSRGVEMLKKAGSWLKNLINAQESGEIPIRDKKYNPETESYEQIKKPQSVVKVHLPEGSTEGAYKFRSGSLSGMNEEKDPAWRIAQKTQDAQIVDVDAEQLTAELEYHFANPEKGRPLLIWGAPGIGKTSVVKGFGLKTAGVPVIEVILSLMEPTDVAGLPGVEPDSKYGGTKRSVNFLPMIWPLDNGDIEKEDENGKKIKIPGKGGIIFLDEVNRAHPAVQAAMLKVVLDREIAAANYKIPDKWLILAAANRPEDEPGLIKPMSLALANRFAQVNFISDPKNWSKWARGTASADLSDEVIAFVELMQDYFYVLPAGLSGGREGETTMGVTPRAWEYAAREYKERRAQAIENGSDITEATTRLIFDKHVGKKVSAIITDFLETVKVWPVDKVYKIFTDPMDPTVVLPSNSAGTYDLRKSYGIMYLASRYKLGEKLTKEEFTNFVQYLTNLDSGEIAMSSLTSLKRTHPEIKDYLGDVSLEKYVTPFIEKYQKYMKEV
jgi:predicted AAA+ superfamily ATPase